VAQLLRAVWAALPDGGRIVVSEPMGGGDAPDPATDVYFSVYTMAMQTGRVRSGDEITRLMTEAGFADCQFRQGFRPFVTSIVTGVKTVSDSTQKGV